MKNINDSFTKDSTKIKSLPCHLFLIGFMGCGKSSVSDRLKKKLSVRKIEMDQEIARSEGMPITDIFSSHGEDYFRDLETSFIRDLKNIPPAVISCGGGAVIRPENVAMMREMGKVILLTASPESIYKRVRKSTDRPLLNGNMNVDYISQLMEARRPRYEKAADLTISTDGKNIGQIANEILSHLP